jgi:predicted porin
MPTAKPAPAPAPNCFSSFWSWLNSSADDCPLSYAGITAYATIDVGYDYQTHGAPFNPSTPNGVAYGIQKYSRDDMFLRSGQQLDTSTIGLTINEPLAYGWSLVGAAQFGFNPYSLMLTNGPRSLADNNVNAPVDQTTNGDSSRAGGWRTAQMYVGLSNTTFGTLTFGRMNSLSYDLIGPYDPLDGSNAFSLIGFSSSFPGFGDTETARINTAFRYLLQYQNFRVAGMAQVGGFGADNPANGFYQGQIGADFGNLSLDGVVSWAKDAVSLSNFAGSNIAQFDHDGYFIKLNNVYYNPNMILKATLSNNTGVMLVAKYKWDKFIFYGGYLYARLANPSDQYVNGFQTIAQGIFVPPGQVTSNNFNVAKVLNTYWTGAKFSVRDELDLAAGIYYQQQNNYLQAPAVCTGVSTGISSNKCAGSQDGISFLIDYKPVKRVDFYAGMMISNVYGGLASGFLHTQNIDPGVGLRIKF